MTHKRILEKLEEAGIKDYDSCRFGAVDVVEVPCRPGAGTVLASQGNKTIATIGKRKVRIYEAFRYLKETKDEPGKESKLC